MIYALFRVQKYCFFLNCANILAKKSFQTCFLLKFRVSKLVFILFVHIIQILFHNKFFKAFPKPLAVNTTTTRSQWAIEKPRKTYHQPIANSFSPLLAAVLFAVILNGRFRRVDYVSTKTCFLQLFHVRMVTDTSPKDHRVEQLAKKVVIRYLGSEF